MQIYACIVLNCLFCESQLGIVSNIENYHLNERCFDSKADYQLFCYYRKQPDLSNHQKLVFLEKQVIPYLSKYDGVTRYQIEMELKKFKKTHYRQSILAKLYF